MTITQSCKQSQKNYERKQWRTVTYLFDLNLIYYCYHNFEILCNRANASILSYCHSSCHLDHSSQYTHNIIAAFGGGQLLMSGVSYLLNVLLITWCLLQLLLIILYLLHFSAIIWCSLHFSPLCNKVLFLTLSLLSPPPGHFSKFLEYNKVQESKAEYSRVQ